MKYISSNLEETKNIAQKFVEKILEKQRDAAILVTLEGDLGSGKTTFTKAVAEIFGIKDTVTSPTFVLEKIYQIHESSHDLTHFVHIDAYRLSDGKEMETLGWKELVESPHNIIFLEWPERVSGEIPETAEKILLRFVNENTREIVF